MDSTQKLIKLVEHYVECIDLEMEHGDYRVPENYVPFKFEDEEDYWGRHEEIVNDVCDAYAAIRTFINDYRSRKNKKVCRYILVTCDEHGEIIPSFHMTLRSAIKEAIAYVAPADEADCDRMRKELNELAMTECDGVKCQIDEVWTKEV